MQGRPAGTQVSVAPHTSDGEGLFEATTGEQASFANDLVETNGIHPGTLVWNVDGSPLIYVRIASGDKVFIARVEASKNGTTIYSSVGSGFPGQ